MSVDIFIGFMNQGNENLDTMLKELAKELSIVAAQYRLQGWAVQIRACQGRLASMGVID